VSFDPNTLDTLQYAGAIKRLVGFLERQGNFATDMHNQVLNTLYNLCRMRLSRERQELAARAGIIPYLQNIIKTNNVSLKHFALPIICDMAHAKGARAELWKNDSIQFWLYQLLSRESYQVSALEGLAVWFYDETKKNRTNFSN